MLYQRTTSKDIFHYLTHRSNFTFPLKVQMVVSLPLLLRPGRTCSSSLTWLPSSTTTACTWPTTCSPWATVSKLTCRSNTARALPHLLTWCPDSGSWVNKHDLYCSMGQSFHFDMQNIIIYSAVCLEICWAASLFFQFPQGARCFLAQMNVQRAELLERLSTAHNFCNLDDEDNYIAASKAVRQVREKGLDNKM